MFWNKKLKHKIDEQNSTIFALKDKLTDACIEKTYLTNTKLQIENKKLKKECDSLNCQLQLLNSVKNELVKSHETTSALAKQIEILEIQNRGLSQSLDFVNDNTTKEEPNISNLKNKNETYFEDEYKKFFINKGYNLDKINRAYTKKLPLGVREFSPQVTEAMIHLYGLNCSIDKLSEITTIPFRIIRNTLSYYGLDVRKLNPTATATAKIIDFSNMRKTREIEVVREIVDTINCREIDSFKKVDKYLLVEIYHKVNEVVNAKFKMDYQLATRFGNYLLKNKIDKDNLVSFIKELLQLNEYTESLAYTAKIELVHFSKALLKYK